MPMVDRLDRREVGRNLGSVIRGLLGILSAFAIAEWFTRLELVPAAYLPHASTIAFRALQLLVDHAFLVNLGASVVAWGICLVLVTVVGVPVGLMLGSSQTAFAIFSPVVNLMRPIPSVCLLPLAMLLFGTGFLMKVVLVSYAMAWPILFNTIYAMHELDPITVETARCFGLTRSAILRRIGLPSAMPFIFTGIRVSASIGLIVLVSSELLSDTQIGIGAFIMRNSTGGGEVDTVFAAAGLTGLLGVAINAAFIAIDRRQFAWQYASERPS